MKRLNILKYPWHTGHDYELAKLPHNFLYIKNTYRSWATSHRPIPENVTWVSSVSDVPSDLMILHLDQWSFDEPAKRFLFLNFRNSYQGPKVVIIHGCNMVDGCTSERMAELIRGCHVVCNSQTAQEMWNLPDSTFIRHGMTPEEWPLTNFENNNIIINQPFNNRHLLTRNHEGILRAEAKVSLTWIGRDVKFNSFHEYKEFLQTSSIFFNPSYASANPRSRTEAMLMGLAVVTTNSHGEDEYIENGVNGYCSNDFNELIDCLKILKADPKKARQIGLAGRKTAQEFFHINRFIKSWNNLLHEIVNKSAPTPFNQLSYARD